MRIGNTSNWTFGRSTNSHSSTFPTAQRSWRTAPGPSIDRLQLDSVVRSDNPDPPSKFGLRGVTDRRRTNLRVRYSHRRCCASGHHALAEQSSPRTRAVLSALRRFDVLVNTVVGEPSLVALSRPRRARTPALRKPAYDYCRPFWKIVSNDGRSGVVDKMPTILPFVGVDSAALPNRVSSHAAATRRNLAYRSTFSNF